MDLSENMSSSVLSEKRSNTKKVIKKKSYASIITKASSLTISKATVEVSQKTDGKSSAPPKNEKDITTEASREVLKKDKSSLPTKTGSSSSACFKPFVASKNIGTSESIVIFSAYYLDGHRYAFMEFNNQNAAKLAVEAAFIQFDGWECAVEYKKGDTQGQEGRGTGSVGDNKSGDNNGNGDGSNPVV
ncbi:nuclear transport factor 2 [Tanacetum coccineum]